MALTLVSDPIISLSDAQELLDVQNEPLLIATINALTEKFLHYTGRVQINSGSVEEWTRGDGERRLWLHSSPVDTAETITATIYEADSEIETYSYADGDFRVGHLMHQSWLEHYTASWPDKDSVAIVKVEYTGGWSETPGDVLMGAVMQARIDLKRMAGIVGMRSVSSEGESTSYEIESLIKAVRDVWRPYVVLT